MGVGRREARATQDLRLMQKYANQQFNQNVLLLIIKH